MFVILYIYIYIYIYNILYYILYIHFIGKSSSLFPKYALPLIHLGQTFPISDEIKLLKFIFNI